MIKKDLIIVEIVAGRNLTAMDDDGFSDPYVIVSCSNEKFQTKVIYSTLNPIWEVGSLTEKFVFRKALAKQEKNIFLRCMDRDRFKADDRLGMVTIPISSLSHTKDIDEWFPLVAQKTGDAVSGEIHVRLQIKRQEKVPRSPLWRALLKANTEQVNKLLSSPNNLNLNETDPVTGYTLLHVAVMNSTAAVVDRLLQAGCSVEKTDIDGNTPLHSFCRYFSFPDQELLKKFLEKGLQVDCPNKFGETPLHHVTSNPAIKVVLAEYLLHEGANVNAQTHNKDTPLHYAIQLGRPDLVKLLLSFGADCLSPGSKGLIPLALARMLGFIYVQDSIRDTLELKKHLEKIGMTKYLYPLSLEEVYVYLIPDLTESAIAKIISCPEDRAKIISSGKDIKTLNRQETFMRQQEHFKKRSKMVTKEKSVLNALHNSIKQQQDSWMIDVDDIEFVQLLGSGSFGSVYKGLYNGNTVAIKMLKSTDKNWDAELKEFTDEFKIAYLVQSPHIVRFFGATTKNQLCMVMEFCSKGSLYDLLKDDKMYFDWELSLKMLRDITTGLNVLHSQKPAILHRDMKTLNVLVTSELTCKLCDFGLSRLDTSSSANTLAKCRGTYAYLAPEVYGGKGFKVQSDVYSIGIMIWEFANRLVTGSYQRPYSDIKVEFQILIQAHVKGKRPPIPEETPESLKHIITQTWDANWEVRPTSEKLLEQLEVITSEYQKNKEAWDSVSKNKIEKPTMGLHKKVRSESTTTTTTDT